MNTQYGFGMVLTSKRSVVDIIRVKPEQSGGLTEWADKAMAEQDKSYPEDAPHTAVIGYTNTEGKDIPLTVLTGEKS